MSRNGSLLARERIAFWLRELADRLDPPPIRMDFAKAREVIEGFSSNLADGLSRQGADKWREAIERRKGSYSDGA